MLKQKSEIYTYYIVADLETIAYAEHKSLMLTSSFSSMFTTLTNLFG